MRISSSQDSKKFLSKLASTCKCDQKPIIVAGEKQDTKDEAIDCAKTYWMMGWTWDEIEVVLEDSEYPSTIVSQALKEAKDYAKEILNKGPFSELKAGQIVKLESGSFGILDALYQDHAYVDIKGIGRTKVPLEQLNKVACGKLAEAFSLRKQASDMISCLDKSTFNLVASRSVNSNTSLELLNKVSTIDNHASKLLNKISVFSERLRVEAKDKIKLSSRNKELVQLCGAIVSQEKEIISEITSLLDEELSEKIAALYELDKDKTEVQSALEDLEAIMSGTIEHLIDSSEIIKIAESEFGSTHWSESSLKVANENWNSTQKYFDTFSTDVRTRVLQARDKIVRFIEQAKKEDITKKVTASLKARV